MPTNRRNAIAVAALIALVALSLLLVGGVIPPRTVAVEDFESGGITAWQAVGGGAGGWFVYADGYKMECGGPPRHSRSSLLYGSGRR